MKQRVLWIVLAAAAFVAALGWLFVTGGRGRGTVVEVVPAHAPATPTPAPEQRVILLFAGEDGLLHPELRSVGFPDEIAEQVRVVVAELAAGSHGSLAPVFPYHAELLNVFVVARERLVFIDISAPPEPLEGSHSELLLAYAVVDSVLLNCPELSAVQLLFGGHEVPTLAGHLDLSRPLSLNKGWIAAS